MDTENEKVNASEEAAECQPEESNSCVSEADQPEAADANACSQETESARPGMESAADDSEAQDYQAGQPENTVTAQEHTEGYTEVKKSKKVWKIVIAIVALILVLLICCAVYFVKYVKEAVYYQNMETAAYTMLDGCANAETAGNLMLNVWKNAIWSEADAETDPYTKVNGAFVDDFNDALANLYADEEFSADISDIQSNKTEVLALMKELNDPPEKYEEAYSVLKDFYEDYTKFTDIVVNCSGSYNSVSEDFGKYDDEVLSEFRKIQLYLD